jgi:hypothetical protein
MPPDASRDYDEYQQQYLEPKFPSNNFFRTSQAFAGSDPESGAIFVTTNTSNKVAVLRKLPEMVMSASETRGCCSASVSRRSLML